MGVAPVIVNIHHRSWSSLQRKETVYWLISACVVKFCVGLGLTWLLHSWPCIGPATVHDRKLKYTMVQLGKTFNPLTVNVNHTLC